jgi:hypothetical protein
MNTDENPPEAGSYFLGNFHCFSLILPVILPNFLPAKGAGE